MTVQCVCVARVPGGILRGHPGVELVTTELLIKIGIVDIG